MWGGVVANLYDCTKKKNPSYPIYIRAGTGDGRGGEGGIAGTNQRTENSRARRPLSTSMKGDATDPGLGPPAVSTT